MALTVDLRPPAREPGASLGRSQDGEPAWTVEAETSPPAPATRHYSFWADCECPDDCLRDHENE
jgi:hypothetical protein